jgi:hypothetical protein
MVCLCLNDVERRSRGLKEICRYLATSILITQLPLSKAESTPGEKKPFHSLQSVGLPGAMPALAWAWRSFFQQSHALSSLNLQPISRLYLLDRHLNLEPFHQFSDPFPGRETDGKGPQSVLQSRYDQRPAPPKTVITRPSNGPCIHRPQPEEEFFLHP